MKLSDDPGGRADPLPCALETKGLENIEIKSWQQGLFSISNLQTSGWTRLDYSSTARLGYTQNPVAHRCIRLISEAVGSLTLAVQTEAQGQLDVHPLLSVLNRPNERQSRSEFLQALIGYYQVAGSAFVHGIASSDGTPLELHLLRPDTVQAVMGADGWPHCFECGTGATKKRIAAHGWRDPSGNILQISSFNPLEPQTGLSPLQSAQAALKVHNAAAGWNLALLENSARPSGALVFAPKDGGNLTEDQFERLKSELEENYTGPKAAGRPLVLEGGLDWKAMGYSPKDMDFIEAKQAAAREIALALGVPPMLLGLPGDNTYSNYQEANRAFWRQTIVPLVHKVLGALSHWLSPAFDGDCELTFDAEKIPELSNDRDSLWQRVNEADFLTEDEKRAAVGYGPRQNDMPTEDA